MPACPSSPGPAATSRSPNGPMTCRWACGSGSGSRLDERRRVSRRSAGSCRRSRRPHQSADPRPVAAQRVAAQRGVRAGADRSAPVEGSLAQDPVAEGDRGGRQVRPRRPPRRRAGGAPARGARHEQRDRAGPLHRRGAHYVFVVKGNRPRLHQQLAGLPWRDIPAVDLRFTQRRIVDRDGEPTPSSSNTRIGSTLLVGSMIRPAPAPGTRRRRSRCGRARSRHLQLQHLLITAQPLLVVRGADVVDPHHRAAAFVHDPHRRRAPSRSSPAARTTPRPETTPVPGVGWSSDTHTTPRTAGQPASHNS